MIASVTLTLHNLKTSIDGDLYFNHQKIHLKTLVDWKGNQLFLNDMTLKDEQRFFTGKIIIDFSDNGIAQATALGSGKFYTVEVKSIKGKYDPTKKINFILEGMVSDPVLQNVLPGVAKVVVTPFGDRLKATITSQSIVGDLYVSFQKEMAIQAVLQKLALHSSQGGSSVSIDPVKIPTLSIKIHQLFLDNYKLGKFFLLTKKIKDGLAFDQVHMDSHFVHASAKGFWIKDGSGQRTVLSGHVNSDDFGQWILRSHGVHNVQGGDFKSTFKLQANASPFNLNLNNMIAVSIFKLKNAIYLTKKEEKQSGGINVLESIFNLISLQSIGSLISLDFSGLVPTEGFRFNSLKGTLHLNKGMLTSKEVKMNSPIAQVTFSGKVNMHNGNEDMMMKIYPNILPSNSWKTWCPVIFIVRFSIWLAKKISGPFLNPILMMQYHVTGTVSKPVVKRIYF